MKKVYISPIVEKIDIPYEESILAGSNETTQDFGNGEGEFTGGITDGDDDIVTLSKGNSLFFESED